MHAKYEKEVNDYEHDLDMDNLILHRDTLEHRRYKLFKKLNVK